MPTMRELERDGDALRRAVERDRSELRDAVQDLASVARARVDVAARIREQPAPWLGGAFALGFALGAWRGRTRGIQEVQRWTR